MNALANSRPYSGNGLVEGRIIRTLPDGSKQVSLVVRDRIPGKRPTWYTAGVVTPHAEVGGCTLYRGEALEVLRAMPDASVDSIVTDPPAGISFMGKGWDGDKGGRAGWVAYMAERFAEALRVAKPGAHALVWALPRTSHWTAMALEDAGWEIREVVHHLFGTGFPKSLDVSKAIDKQKSNGWGTALKPAAEHWILARKPLQGTVAANVLEHGTGALNIDGCRIEIPGGDDGLARGRKRGTFPHSDDSWGRGRMERTEYSPSGRWPANVVLSCWCEGEEHDEGCAVGTLDEQSGELRSGKMAAGTPRRNRAGFSGPLPAATGRETIGDSGGASRFFYVAKPSPRERNAAGAANNTHPTVKPIDLMRYLARLITPPDGVVLDMFGGSGTTGCACIREGFRCITIEADYEEGACEIAVARWRAEIESEKAEIPAMLDLFAQEAA